LGFENKVNLFLYKSPTIDKTSDHANLILLKIKSSVYKLLRKNSIEGLFFK